MYDELVKSLRICTSDKRGSGCGSECSYGKKHPLNYWCMDYLLTEAADAIEDLIAERDKYKRHSDSISQLPDCNTCGKKTKGSCEFMPAYGDWVRINCAFGVPEPPKEET